MADNRSSLMARTAYLALEEKKAEDIKLIDIEKVSVIADYFLIASGTSATPITRPALFARKREIVPIPQ